MKDGTIVVSNSRVKDEYFNSINQAYPDHNNIYINITQSNIAYDSSHQPVLQHNVSYISVDHKTLDMMYEILPDEQQDNTTN